MVQIPENAVTEADLSAWYNLQLELKRIKAAEILLRTKIFNSIFTKPKEGTNSFELSEGYVLKGKYTLNREIDIGTFQALRQQFEKAGIHPDSLIKWEPDLKIKEYRELTEEQMKLFDQCLIIKPGSPALEIVLPKKRG